MLPRPVVVLIALVLVALLAYNIVVVGPDGYPTSVILGGLLGTILGIKQLFDSRRGGGSGDGGSK